jgi:hypothetical protein
MAENNYSMIRKFEIFNGAKIRIMSREITAFYQHFSGYPVGGAPCYPGLFHTFPCQLETHKSPAARKTTIGT